MSTRGVHGASYAARDGTHHMYGQGALPSFGQHSPLVYLGCIE